MLKLLLGAGAVGGLIFLATRKKAPVMIPRGASYPIGPGDCGPGMMMSSDGWCRQGAITGGLVNFPEWMKVG